MLGRGFRGCSWFGRLVCERECECGHHEARLMLAFDVALPECQPQLSENHWWNKKDGGERGKGSSLPAYPCDIQDTHLAFISQSMPEPRKHEGLHSSSQEASNTSTPNQPEHSPVWMLFFLLATLLADVRVLTRESYQREDPKSSSIQKKNCIAACQPLSAQTGDGLRARIWSGKNFDVISTDRPDILIQCRI